MFSHVQFDGALVPVIPYSILMASTHEAIVLEQYTESLTGILCVIGDSLALVLVGPSGPNGAIINIPTTTLIAQELTQAPFITCVMPSRHGESWVDHRVQILHT